MMLKRVGAFLITALLCLLATGPSQSFFARQGAHNGGISQTNLDFLYSPGTFPFINFFKAAYLPWGCASPAVLPNVSELNSNGYPISGATCSQFYTALHVPSQSEYATEWVLDWVGTGAINFNFSFSYAPGYGPSNLKGTNGRVVIVPNVKLLVIQMSPDFGDPITNIRFYPIAEEAALNSGEIFAAKFLERLRQMKVGVLRFMNWTNANDTNVTRFDQAKPESYFTWTADQYDAAIWAGTTTNSGDDYFSSFPPANNPTNLATIQLRWNANASSANVTLNGVPVLSLTGSVLSSTRYPLTNAVSTLVYVSDFGAWFKFGGDTTAFNVGIQNGAPRSVMLKLVNLLGLHPWDNVPYLADPFTFANDMASFWRDGLHYGLIPRIEWANEIWGGGRPGFNGTTWCINVAAIWWPGQANDQNNCYGKMASLSGQGVSAAFNNDRSRYVFVAGVMTHAVHTDGKILATNDARLTSEYYVADNGGNTYYAAHNWATHITIANYFNSTWNRTSFEVNSAFVYPSSDVSTQTSLMNTYVGGVYDAGTGTGAYQFGLPRTWLLYRSWAGWGVNFGIPRMLGYEGGYSPDYIPYSPAPTASITNITKGATTDLTLGNDVRGLPWTATPGISGSTTGDTTNQSAVITNIPSTAGLRIGNPVSGTGIPTKASIRSINSATQITLTSVATATNTGTTLNYFTGMQIRLSGIVGTTQLNGNTYNVIAAAGNVVTIDVDSTAFGDYKSGGTVTFANIANYVNNFRMESKKSPLLTQATLSNYTQFLISGGYDPSNYLLAGEGNGWAVLDPSIYVPLTPQFNAISQFNSWNKGGGFLLKRDLAPASNDNTPMYLNIAA